MHIVITNDDGIRAPGIHALAKAAREFGKVTVIAPDKNWSVCGHSKAIGRPLRLDPYEFPEADAAWVSDGSPSDCAAFAGLGFLEEPVDMLLSGINPTPNLGQDATYSGTVMAAAEATFWGLNAAAFSIDCPRIKQELIDFGPAVRVLPKIIAYLSQNKLPPFTLLNVNCPSVPAEEIRGIRMTRFGTRIYKDVLIRETDPFGRPYYWFGGDPPESVEEEGTDGRVMKEGYVSITPIHQDMTAYSLLDELQSLDWEKDI
ncbi:MAG: 5'/3'-nucleotidase SurE [Anaerolineaceae bacterium]|nr:5'/3'-nucleotidase SurE [Anaerolineaceae bacterium]